MITYRTHAFRVRYTETDQMGFAHHSNYLNYFEMARIEWLHSRGFSYATLEKQGIVMPVVAVDIKFKSPAFFDDILTIQLSVNEAPKASIKIQYIVINEKEEELAIGSTTLAFLNTQTQRPIRCPESLLKIF